MAEESEFLTEIVIEAEPELVYEFFTDPKLLRQWHGVYAETDLRPGGNFLLNVTGEDITQGKFLEVDPGKRLVFTWGFKTMGSSTVEVCLTPVGKSTRVSVRHSGFKNDEDRRGHEQGWNDYLQRLAIVAKGGTAGTDPRRTEEGDRIAAQS